MNDGFWFKNVAIVVIVSKVTAFSFLIKYHEWRNTKVNAGCT